MKNPVKKPYWIKSNDTAGTNRDAIKGPTAFTPASLPLRARYPYEQPVVLLEHPEQQLLQESVNQKSFDLHFQAPWFSKRESNSTICRLNQQPSRRGLPLNKSRMSARTRGVTNANMLCKYMCGWERGERVVDKEIN